MDPGRAGLQMDVDDVEPVGMPVAGVSLVEAAGGELVELAIRIGEQRRRDRVLVPAQEQIDVVPDDRRRPVTGPEVGQRVMHESEAEPLERGAARAGLERRGATRDRGTCTRSCPGGTG